MAERFNIENLGLSKLVVRRTLASGSLPAAFRREDLHTLGAFQFEFNLKLASGQQKLCTTKIDVHTQPQVPDFLPACKHAGPA